MSRQPHLIPAEPLNTLKLSWQRGDCEVSWEWEGRRITRSYQQPVRSVAIVADPLSIIIVEPHELSAPANALVVEPDGSERLRLIAPDSEDPIGFDQVFVSAARKVEAVFATRLKDLHGEPDLETGIIRNPREWR